VGPAPSVHARQEGDWDPCASGTQKTGPGMPHGGGRLYPKANGHRALPWGDPNRGFKPALKPALAWRARSAAPGSKRLRPDRFEKEPTQSGHHLEGAGPGITRGLIKEPSWGALHHEVASRPPTETSFKKRPESECQGLGRDSPGNTSIYVFLPGNFGGPFPGRASPTRQGGRGGGPGVSLVRGFGWGTNFLGGQTSFSKGGAGPIRPPPGGAPRPPRGPGDPAA